MKPEETTVTQARSSGSIFNYLIGRVDRTGIDPRVSLHWFLRIACAMCWIGHGAWGIITKAGWLPFFYTFGIPEEYAWRIMPIVGTMDITMGIALLFYPCRANLTWMFVWTVFTALLRPLSGMGWWEFLERGGNYGPPLAFLFLATANGPIGWFDKIQATPVNPVGLRRAMWTLRVAIAFLLIGHGGFGAFQQKQVLIDHWRAIGIDATASTVTMIGWGEIVAGVLALFVPFSSYFMAIWYWKVGTELLYPVAGRLVDTWEWVERGGDYGALLALISIFILLRKAARNQEKDAHAYRQNLSPVTASHE